MHELLMSLDSFSGCLLFALAAFCDTLIGVGFFVFGEIAFLAAGAMFTATGEVWPGFIVVAFAWAGDIASFHIGRRYGPRLSLRMLHKRRRRRAWRKARAALDRHGAGFVVASRLLGPTAWVTPFLAGTMGMRWSRFAPAAAIGVLLGVGQFVLLGALGLKGLSQVLAFVADHAWSIALLVLLSNSAMFIWRRSKAKLPARAAKTCATVVVLFLASNLTYFFVADSHAALAAPNPVVASACEVAGQPLLAYPGETGLHLPQPVNVILLSTETGSDLVRSLGWIQNMTFSRDQISFATYMRLLLQGTPPVSELIFAGQPADSAYQLPGTIKSREHVRWWEIGPNISVGAISRDDELAIKYYRDLPVLLHDIDPYVDRSRDLLAAQVSEGGQYEVVGYAPLGDPVPEGRQADFETDGRVLVLAESGVVIEPEIVECLSLERSQHLAD